MCNLNTVKHSLQYPHNLITIILNEVQWCLGGQQFLWGYHRLVWTLSGWCNNLWSSNHNLRWLGIYTTIAVPGPSTDWLWITPEVCSAGCCLAFAEISKSLAGKSFVPVEKQYSPSDVLKVSWSHLANSRYKWHWTSTFGNSPSSHFHMRLLPFTKLSLSGGAIMNSFLLTLLFMHSPKFGLRRSSIVWRRSFAGEAPVVSEELYSKW